MENIKVAVAQDAPILFDLEASLRKVRDIVEEASKENTNLIVFPEAFLPGYPRGLSFGTTIGNRSEEGKKLWLKYGDNSVEVPGAAVDFLSEVAGDFNVYLVIGVVEKGKNGTLYCCILYFDNAGNLIGKHRKLKPTGSERIIWGEGDGSDLQTYPTPYGRIGGLICWENYMPLVRMALYENGIDIYLAPTADQRDSWQATMKHIACEGRCFVIGCNQYVRKSDYPDELLPEIENFNENVCIGGSVIVDPSGQIVAGPLWNDPGILYTTLAMEEVQKGKMDFDVVGHYARRDVFSLSRHRKA